MTIDFMTAPSLRMDMPPSSDLLRTARFNRRSPC
jgi:hypothetical protein